MFEDYLATKKDLKAIEEALAFALNPKMRFVFSDISRIKKTLTISCDSKYIYAWRINPIKLILKIPHNLKISDEWQRGWRMGLQIPKIMNLLPLEVKNSTRFEIPIINGGLLTPFIELQKRKDLPKSPYVTRESYLATIIHEFGHVYWNSFKLWWFSNKKKNIEYLRMAQKLYNKKGMTKKNVTLNLPTPWPLSEVFAFCTEYFASDLFWKNHKKNHDLFTLNRLNILIDFENKKDLDRESSTIEPETFSHDFASVLGKLVITKYPNTWPQILTKYKPALLP